jgi:hypothetical protein
MTAGNPTHAGDLPEADGILPKSQWHGTGVPETEDDIEATVCRELSGRRGPSGGGGLLEGELPSYEEAVAEMRHPIDLAGTGEAARLRDLVRQATLAASSHNTQPWKFMLAERSIKILPDLTRRTSVVDPDDHHLFVSLGCATENLVHAALASGLHADVRIEDNAIAVAFDETRPVRSPLFEAIPIRQCSRTA